MYLILHWLNYCPTTQPTIACYCTAKETHALWAEAYALWANAYESGVLVRLFFFKKKFI